MRSSQYKKNIVLWLWDLAKLMHCIYKKTPQKTPLYASAGKSANFSLTKDFFVFAREEKNDLAPALQFGDASYSEIAGIVYSDEGFRAT